jgi:RNA polymerase sigma-70 factor (ECF subfamily)
MTIYVAAKSMPPHGSESISAAASRQDELYEEAVAGYGAALERLARAYEANPESCRDLVQEIHIALWRSLAKFDGRCSLRTWVYRVAHNIGVSHVVQDRRAKSRNLVSLEEIDAIADQNNAESTIDRHKVLNRLFALIQLLRPLDRQIILLYLEDLDAGSIGEITGISARNVATKIHRIKNLLVRQFHEVHHGSGA